jgi:transcription antitermination factor NusG
MSSWRDIKEHTYVCVTYNEAGISAKNKKMVNGFFTGTTDTEVQLYFKRFNRILIEFVVPVEYISKIEQLPTPVKKVTGGNKTTDTIRSELLAINTELARIAEIRATVPDDMSRKVAIMTTTLATLVADTDKRFAAANQQLSRILDTVDSRFAKHSDIVKAISGEFKTVNARVAKVEAAVGVLNSRITRIAEWVSKHN